MKSQGVKPELFIKKGGELSLPGPAFVKLVRAVLDKGALFRFRAKGFSMSPFIEDGDVLTLTSLAGTSPRCGDVVAFRRPQTGKLIIHRVVEKRGTSYLIRGDNSPEGDGLVPKANILGYVTKVERDGKKVFLGLGPERFLIAFLIRRGVCFRLLLLVWRPFNHMRVFKWLKKIFLGP